MKALSLWQPWASLLVWGEKRVETRGWSTKHRGPLVIAATASRPSWLGASASTELFRRHLSNVVRGRKDLLMLAITFNCELCDVPLPLASVLGIVNLVSIEPITPAIRADLSEQELAFGNYEDGRYAWFTEPLEIFATPIPAKGNRMLWNWERPA